MSSAITLARPYARAAFELARSANALAVWSTKLQFVAQVAAHPQITRLIDNPRLNVRDLLEVFLPPNEPTDSFFAQYLTLLAENRRLGVLPEIAVLFEQHKLEAERVLKVRARTAVPIADAQVVQLKEALKKRFGRDIELEQTIDPAIVCGAVIDAGDVVIDGSVSGRLKRLENALAH